MANPEVVNGELPLEHAGDMLRRGREAAGLSHADVAAKTKIPLRHLISLEQNDYAAIPGRTYALGFARTYAKSLGLDADAIANAVRWELDSAAAASPARPAPAFEPGDPARVPDRKLAWLAAMAGLVVLIAGLIYWQSTAGVLPAAPDPAPSVAPAPTMMPSDPAAMASGLPSGIPTAIPGFVAPSQPGTARSGSRPTGSHGARHMATTPPSPAITAQPAENPATVSVPVVQPLPNPAPAKPSTVTP